MDVEPGDHSEPLLAPVLGIQVPNLHSAKLVKRLAWLALGNAVCNTIWILTLVIDYVVYLSTTFISCPESSSPSAEPAPSPSNNKILVSPSPSNETYVPEELRCVAINAQADAVTFITLIAFFLVFSVTLPLVQYLSARRRLRLALVISFCVSLGMTIYCAYFCSAIIYAFAVVPQLTVWVSLWIVLLSGLGSSLFYLLAAVSGIQLVREIFRSSKKESVELAEASRVAATSTSREEGTVIENGGARV